MAPFRSASKNRRWSRLAIVGGSALALYGTLAYVVLPWAWTHHERQPALSGREMVTRTGQGIPGDPINVGLVGAREDVARAMHSAGWFPADPLTLRTSAEIVGSVVLDRPYRDAPVSNLYFDGRREDLAFEKPVGTSADRRHHVRLWDVLEQGAEGRPVWLGSVTFDAGVGLSHYTGAITHRISPDIDAEREGLMSDLAAAEMLEARYRVTGVGPTLFGRNGEGDRYRTDGEVDVGVLVQGGRPHDGPPAMSDSPPLVALKDRLWRQLAPASPPT